MKIETTASNKTPATPSEKFNPFNQTLNYI